MSELTAYVINLAHRTDRWASVENQRSLLGIPITRVEAIDQESIDLSSVRFAANGVAATWLSHKKAAAEFLKTGSNFAVILEDDFQVLNNFKIPSMGLLSDLSVDFCQLGYLRVTPWESFDINIANFRDNVLRVIKWSTNINRYFRDKYQKRLLIRELNGVPFSLVPSDIRPGGHCYIVSRKMATAMQELNTPIIFSADELFISISKMRAFRMYRIRKSLVKQSDSVSSVTSRFKI